MSAEKVNMFGNAAKERRSKFIEENEDVADKILSTRPNSKDNTIKKLLVKNKPIKRQCSYYLDANIDDFFIGLSEIIEVSKSELVNQLLKIIINEYPEIQEMASDNKKINKILQEYKGY